MKTGLRPNLSAAMPNNGWVPIAKTLATTTSHSVTELGGQILEREDIHRHAQQLLQLVLQPPQIQQRRAGQGLHQQIQVAAVLVIAPRSRAKHPRVGHPIACRCLKHSIAVLAEGEGRAHGLEFSGAACF